MDPPHRRWTPLQQDSVELVKAGQISHDDLHLGNQDGLATNTVGLLWTWRYCTVINVQRAHIALKLARWLVIAGWSLDVSLCLSQRSFFP